MQVPTIAEASRLLRARELSPVELTELCLSRIDELDAGLNSFILVLAEEAMARARQAEAEIAAGNWRGPLHGIPLGLKDNISYKGHPTTGHSALFKDTVSTQDADVARRLRDAGAIVLGKLATWEFGVGGPSDDVPWPPARNPWDAARDPGGSSNGPAVAIAAGLCLGALGTDTGGSVRYPSAFCGIAGHKPTYGLVSRRGLLPLSATFDCAGPMAWTAEDCRLLLHVIEGPDPSDMASAPAPSRPPRVACDAGLADLRIGVIRNFHEVDLPATEEVAAAFEESLAVFKSLGARLNDVSLPPLKLFQSAALSISRADAFAVYGQLLREKPAHFGAIGRRRIAAGAFVTASDYVNAQRQRLRLSREIMAVMRDVDVLVCPTTREPAPPIGGDRNRIGGSNHFCRPFSLTGQPALSVCNGFSSDGMPLSLQIVGRHFEDDLLLRIGEAYESVIPHRGRRPPRTMPKGLAAGI